LTTNEPEHWTNAGLIDHIKAIQSKMDDRAFAFILGAGASRESGIPTGGELVERWLKELRLRHDPNHAEGELADWATAANLEITNFEFARSAEFYPAVFQRRFQSDPDEGYAYLEEIMREKRPSFGYSVLSQILEQSRHKIVVTTNFDNLVADAMALYTRNAAMVVGHESLTSFVRPRMRRPLVAKIHRDLFFAPKNDAAGTATLGEGWERALKPLFAHFTPIVVGYGGNDGSLMDFLASLPEGHIPGRLIWTYRSGSPLPNGRIAEVVARHKGAFAPVHGFDEFMLQLREVFSFPLLADHIESEAKDRARQYREAVEALQKRMEAPTPDASAEDNLAQQSLRRSFDGALKALTGWWAWELKARAEPDPVKRETIYRIGLEKYPDSAELTGNTALFLQEVRKDHVEAERLFRHALELDPKNATNTGNFALFLQEERKDHIEAERLFQRAIELDPNDAGRISNFAVFLQEVRKDHVEAERLFRRALEVDPNNADHTGNFASFLLEVRRDYDEAERLFRRTLELDPNHPGHIGNFAVFLWRVRKDYDEAERLFRRALELNPSHSGRTGNFANFLREVREDYDEAERLFRRALELNPSHPGHTGNFANFLWEVRKDHDEAERLFRRALELDPNNANNVANFAKFLWEVRKDGDEAERLFRAGLELDPNDANLTGSFALFLWEVRKDHDEAERLFRRALELDPGNANNAANFVGFLLSHGHLNEAQSEVNRASEILNVETNQAAAEVKFYSALLACLQNRDSTPLLSELKALLLQGFERLYWSFAPILEYASGTLDDKEMAFWRALADAILDAEKVVALEQIPRWREVKPG
jgi:Tfp pilus assembly protein PilF